jgi:hypothetical protein
MWILSGWTMSAPIMTLQSGRVVMGGAGAVQLRARNVVAGVRRITQTVTTASIDGQLVYNGSDRLP